MGHTDKIRCVCPVCQGGSSGEASLSLTKDGTKLLYMCFRASCGFKGALQTNDLGVFYPIGTIAHSPIAKDTIETIAISHRDIYYFHRYYSISYRDIVLNNIRYSTNKNRFYIPCYGYYGDQFGYELKYKSWLGDLYGSKSIFQFTGDPCPKLHFPVQERRESRGVALVEDVLSAIRLARHVPTCALLGTHLSYTGAMQLLDLGYDTLYVVLDEDATGKAVKLFGQYCLMFNGFKIIPLWDCDIKDMDEDRLTALVHGTQLGEIAS